MSVKVRPYKRGGWEVDIRVRLPDKTRIRERLKAPATSESGAKAWGEARQVDLIARGPVRPATKKEVPTLAEFVPRFLDGYAKANRHKPSGIAAKETALRVHVVPLLGTKPLDAIGNEDVQRLKSSLRDKNPKTVNNVLTVVNTLLKVAVEWDVIDHVPCTIKLLRTAPTVAAFHDFDEYERLVEASRKVGWAANLAVLLGGEAGLRCGELMALSWTDVDLGKRQLWVRHSEWKGHVTSPKGGRPRCVPLTARLAAALQVNRHLRGPRVLCHEDGRPLTQKVVRELVRKAARRAGLANEGTHTLRHTFCSHLAMRAAPARAIQELAGHKDLSTSQRYMHLSPAAIESAIRLLEQPSVAPRGDIVETADDETSKVSV